MEHGKDGVYAEEESLHVGALLMAVGGFLGAYTFILRGGVFCNAQTANILLLGLNFGLGEYSKAIYYLVPITAYFAGSVISELLSKNLNNRKSGGIRWSTVFVAFEMVYFSVLAFIPLSAPHGISQVAVNFVAAMQFNTFKKIKNVPMATTFCTNHLRNCATNLVGMLVDKSAQCRSRLISHSVMIFSFIAGAIASAFLSNYFYEKCLFGAVLLLGIVFADLLIGDIGKKKNK